MLATLGDLVEDVVVSVADPVNVASDTAATIGRRRGGSAANVASVAARLGCSVRFIGRTGDDPIGTALVADLASDGVDVSFVRRGGRTGTILVLVDAAGERTMLTDRGACTLLDRPDPTWLEGVTTLHVPMYSLVIEPLAGTAATVIEWAHARGIRVSIDVSSVALLDGVGREAALALVTRLGPAVLFANSDEANALAIGGPIGGSVTVVKHGGRPAVVYAAGDRHQVAAESMPEVDDTTGAGDAFAAGFLTANWEGDVVAATRAAHRAAADHIARS